MIDRVRCTGLLLLLVLALPSVSWAAADPTPSALAGRKVTRLSFRGNRKTEDEAIRVNLSMQVGDAYSMEKLREDVRAVWKMGYFEDVKVDALPVEPGGVELTYIVVEKPTIHKIFVQGNSEVGLDKINEVLDIKKDTILDLAKVKRNVEKVHDVYVEKGFYLAEVTSDTRRVSQNEVDVYIIVDEHAKVEVRQVHFLGNKAATEEELKSAIGTQEGGWFSFLTSSGTYKEDAFDRDILMLTGFYYDRGYINVKIGKPEIELSSDKRFLYIYIPLDEGPQFKIGKMDFKGELVAPKEVYYSRLTVQAGETFNRSKLAQDIQHLNELYKDKGYAYVNITPLTNIDADKHIVDLTFDIQKGEKVTIERINIRGNTKTRDKVIRRELRIAEGDAYNQALIDLSKRRVQALGFFEKVDLSTKRGTADDKIDINIEVTERATGTFQIGAGFSSVENFVGQAQIAQNNLLGRGTTLQLQAQISSLRQLFSLRYLDPYFLDTPLTFSFNLYNSLLYYPSFNRTARGGELTWGYLLTDWVRVFGTYKLETVDVAPNQAGLTIGGFAPSVQASPGQISNLFISGLTSALRASINYDTRNDRMFPTRGVFASATAEVADPTLGATRAYSRFTGTVQTYVPIWGPFVFRNRAEVGLITSRSDIGVPIYERYFLGGVNTIRGFNLFSLGPRVNILESQTPTAGLAPFNIGGNLELMLNTEIEFPIFPQVQIKGVLFFDAGNAYNTESRWCALGAHTNIDASQDPCTSDLVGMLSNLRTNIGFGFRWFSPIGPLRFEWGIPLYRLPGEDPVVFQFTIGNFF